MQTLSIELPTEESVGEFNLTDEELDVAFRTLPSNAEIIHTNFYALVFAKTRSEGYGMVRHIEDALSDHRLNNKKAGN